MKAGEGGAIAVLGLAVLGLAGLAAAFMFAAGREPEEPPEELPPEEEEEVAEVIDAELRESYVYWAGLTAWKDVYTRWINEWPADTEITFAWEIRNIGDVGAYFQVYAFTPGGWMYLEPGEKLQVYEEFHTPAIPVTPGYEYSRITILGRKITGERIGAVWTSREFEIVYV